MGADGKFGTFGGVFVPSLLTILGVIMYLRLPWMVGQAGLYVSLGIVLAAHVVSVATGLSVSSIATDKKVGAGGPYYIISRSFGLPIGGAIGLALFLGLSFSVSLYIVGFSQSLLSSFGFETDASSIRIAGSVTLLGITLITFISTSFAIRAQYVILVLVGGSLVAVFLGHPTASSPHLSTSAGSPSFGVLFGIFFPAVTGFTAGVNMSGDLRDPKGAIPKGTMLAIAAGFAVYTGLVIYLALATDPAALRDDPEVLQHTALWEPGVIAGIWGATLSSALGCILGAPRILQAMSADRITPRTLAKGYGPTHEPRRALLIAFAIAEAGILIAELDLIARVVSMVFLALYASINVTCAIESWASPDFRPRFRIPKFVSIIGALSALLLMIQLDILAMLGATVLMIGLFAYLQRRQLTLEAGDTWEGVWATLVRAGLHRMHKKAGKQRNWRPNVLLFDDAGHPRHPAIRRFATTLASGNGLVTDFSLAAPVEGEETVARAPATTAEHVGVFDATIVTEAPFATVASICEFHGFSGLPPNTLLLPWRQHQRDPDGFLRTLQAAAGRELNILLFEEHRAERRLNQQIDVWWARDAGNLALSVALVRFITRAPEWERARINVLIVGDGSDDDAVLRAKSLRYLDGNRVEATVRVVPRPSGETVHDLVCNESRTADLVLLGLPSDLAAADRTSLERLGRVADLPGGIVFLHASTFADVLVPVAAPRAIRAPGTVTPPAGLPALALPRHPELAAAVTSVLAHESGQLTRVLDRIGAAYGLYLELCATARDMVDKRAEAMMAAAREPEVGKRRKLLGGATNEFLAEADRALAQIAAEGVAAQATLLTEVLHELVKPEASMPSGMGAVLSIERPRAELRSTADDSVAMRTWKRRQRWRYFYRRTVPQSIAIRPLVVQAHDHIVQEEVVRVVERFRRATHELALEIGSVLATAEWKAHAQLSRVSLADPDDRIAQIAKSRDDVRRRIEELETQAREKLAEDGAAFDAAAHSQARALSATLDRIDAPIAARETVRGHKRDGELASLPERADVWREQQHRLLARARLAVQLARFRDKLTIASARALGELITTSRASGYRALLDLREALAVRAGQLDAALPEVRDEIAYDGGPIVARLTQSAAVLSGELPETETLLTDDSAAALGRGDSADEMVTVPVRAAVQAIVETELLSRLAADVVRVAEVDARAWAVTRETLVLVSARPRESDDDEPTTSESIDVLARFDAQLAKIHDTEASCADGVFSALQAVADATTTDLMTTSLVERGGRRATAARTPSRALGLLRRGAAGLGAAAANLVYRRSAGAVYAQQARAARNRSPEEVLRELTTRSSVASSVLATLPLYYRNLFTGQVNINEAFFFGRDEQVRAGTEIVTGGRTGIRSVLVTGNRGAGKSTLCQQIASASKAEVHWIAPPPGGAATRDAVASAIETSLGRRGKPGALLGRLPERAVLVFDDLDLWWERRTGGLEAIDAILELVEQHGERIGFVLGGSAPPVRVLQGLRPVSRLVYAQLDCQPLSARTLEHVIMARHNSTGIGLALAGKDSFGAWTRARLFDAHFTYARGNVGYALRSWVTHLDRFADDRLTIRMPKLLDWEAIDDLQAEHVALLIELVLHRAASAAKLERLTGRPAAAISDGLSELTAIGLVVQNRRRIAQLNPFVHVPVIGWLNRRELA
jgi:amino acid transporter